MTIIGGYSLHVECEVQFSDKDFDEANDSTQLRARISHNGTWEYIGQTHAECVRLARKAGWLITDGFTEAWCPYHAKRR